MTREPLADGLPLDLRDEIYRLEAEVERLKELFALKWDATQSAETASRQAEIERLQEFANYLSIDRDRFLADNERLQATLKAIERHTAPSTRTWDTCLRDMGLANDLARAALKPQP